MSLPASQQRALHQIEKTLADDHPGLEPLFGIFTRLTGHEAMPATERLSAQPQRRRGRSLPAVATLAGLAMVIGVLLGISLLLRSPQRCPSGAAGQIARGPSVSAERQPACPSQAASPGNTPQSEP
jgi:Protein of unknown function (DUF3040)